LYYVISWLYCDPLLVDVSTTIEASTNLLLLLDLRALSTTSLANRPVSGFSSISPRTHLVYVLGLGHP